MRGHDAVPEIAVLERELLDKYELLSTLLELIEMIEDDSTTAIARNVAFCVRWGDAFVAARYVAAALERTATRTYARLYLLAREGSEDRRAPSVDDAKMMVENHPDYVTAIERAAQMRMVAERFGGIVQTLRSKGDALREIAQNTRHESR